MTATQTDAPKVKHALCFDRPYAPALYHLADRPVLIAIRKSFDDTPVRLIDRAICENDEKTLQFISYITLMNELGQVFCYYRGEAGEESRLHGDLSLGLGGHVDGLPAPSQTPTEYLYAEGERELKEEAGVILTTPLKYTHIIADPTNPVGRVHMGLFTVAKVHSSIQLDTEKDVITRGFWIHPNELMQYEYFNRLENWSKAVANYLYAR